jgi:ATP-dependent Clp protease ATP-binding subunit ClpA
MKNYFSSMLKEAISFSREESERLNGNCIGTGHLLLAMIRQDNSAVVAVLKSLQVELPELRTLPSEKPRYSNSSRGLPAIPWH